MNTQYSTINLTLYSFFEWWLEQRTNPESDVHVHGLCYLLRRFVSPCSTSEDEYRESEFLDAVYDVFSKNLPQSKDQTWVIPFENSINEFRRACSKGLCANNIDRIKWVQSQLEFYKTW